MKITTEFWDFIEKYLPDYHKRDDVLRHSELQLFIDGHDSTIEKMTIEDAEKELSELSLKFCNEAINAYVKEQSKIVTNPLRCCNCGSTDVQQIAWVSPNENDKVVGYCSDGDEDDNYCNNCYGHTELRPENGLFKVIDKWWQNLDYDDKLRATGYPEPDFEFKPKIFQKFWSGLSVEEKIKKWSTFNNE